MILSGLLRCLVTGQLWPRFLSPSLKEGESSREAALQEMGERRIPDCLHRAGWSLLLMSKGAHQEQLEEEIFRFKIVSLPLGRDTQLGAKSVQHPALKHCRAVLH